MSLKRVPTAVYNSKGVRKAVAREASEEPEFKAAAEKVMMQVRAEMAKHVRTGRLVSALSLEKGRTDYHITADPADYDWHAEFGHYLGDRKFGDSRKWVKGIGVFRDVVARYGGF